MEQNLQIITKKVWNVVRLAFFMLRKGIITKKKLLLGINSMMKRGKIASKVALNSIIFHHYHQHHLHAFPARDGVPEPFHHLKSSSTAIPQAYELSSSSSTPLHHYYFTKKTKNQHQKYYSMPSSNVEGTPYFDAIDYMLDTVTSSAYSGVRQLKITDLPFPMQDEEDCDHRVDRATEDFIKRFYSKLKEQNY